MAEVNARDRRVLRGAFAMLGSANTGDRENARSKIEEILRKNKRTWNDLLELVLPVPSDQPAADPDPNETDAPSNANDVLELTQHIIKEYVHLGAHEALAVALWVLHAHIFRQFMITPRLVLTSPTHGCGKSTLLRVIKHLLPPNFRYAHHITAAAMFRVIDREGGGLLIDEGDNLGLRTDGALRALWNGGHDSDSEVARTIGGQDKFFKIFAPAAAALIGEDLPPPMLSRCIMIRMQRSARKLRKLNKRGDPGLTEAYRQIFIWPLSVKLDLDPEMPSELDTRVKDNWTPLIAIADAFDPEWGARAREAAIALSVHQEKDFGVLALTHTRDILDADGVDFVFSKQLAAALNDLDDAPWAEWCGIRGNQRPHRLSQGELARLFAPFGIWPRSIWPSGPRQPGSSSAKGYRREQFIAAWDAYCPSATGTPAQDSRIKVLRSV